MMTIGTEILEKNHVSFLPKKAEITNWQDHFLWGIVSLTNVYQIGNFVTVNAALPSFPFDITSW